MSHYHPLDDQQNAAAYAAQNPYHNHQQQQPQQIAYQPPVVYVQQQHAQPAYPPHQQVSYQPPQYSAHPQPLHPGGYAPPKHGAGPADPEHGGGGVRPHDPRFEAANLKCRDAPWAILFVLHAIAILVLAVVFLRKYHSDLTSNRDADDDGEGGGQNAIKFNGRSAGIMGVVAAGALLLSWAWLSAFKLYARQLIWACLLASPVFQLILAVLFFGPLHAPTAGIICLITMALNMLYVYLVRSRVPLTAQILSIVVQVLQQFPATTAVAFGAIFVQIAWVICWVIAAAGAMHGLRDSETTTTNPDGTVTRNSHDGLIGLVWFLLLVSFYWTLHVVQNVCHVTTAGVVATWYFRAPDHLPKHPTAQALRRATWSSFGSVCLGSLIISVVNATRAVVNSARNADHPVARVIVLCLLDCLERIVEFFNIYAFTQIAIYGKPYCAAAADTWQLLKSSGISAVINDDLTGTTLFFASLCTGLVGAGGAAVLATTVLPQPLWGLWALIGGLFAMGICAIAMEVISSGVVAFFVVWAEDPAALERSKPHLFLAMQGALEGRPRAHAVSVGRNRR